MCGFFFKIKKIEKKETVNNNNNSNILNENIVFDLQVNAQWPTNTDICCWNCTRYFNGAPVGIPYRKVDGIFYVKGWFCGFRCASSYNDIFGDKYKWVCEALLNELYVVCGNEILPIPKAPPKELLIKFGGNMTDESYDELKMESDSIKILYPPIVPLQSNVTMLKSSEVVDTYRFSKYKKLTAN